MKAFPLWTGGDASTGGMDLRDYFAIHCPEQADKITWNLVREGLGLHYATDIKEWTDEMTLMYRAKKRYEYADAMMKARELK